MQKAPTSGTATVAPRGERRGAAAWVARGAGLKHAGRGAQAGAPKGSSRLGARLRGEEHRKGAGFLGDRGARQQAPGRPRRSRVQRRPAARGPMGPGACQKHATRSRAKLRGEEHAEATSARRRALRRRRQGRVPLKPEERRPLGPGECQRQAPYLGAKSGGEEHAKGADFPGGASGAGWRAPGRRRRGHVRRGPGTRGPLSPGACQR
ncbi:hypothetical protein ACSSS7_006117 [Eimeria intestinalis]